MATSTSVMRELQMELDRQLDDLFPARPHEVAAVVRNSDTLLPLASELLGERDEHGELVGYGW